MHLLSISLRVYVASKHISSESKHRPSNKETSCKTTRLSLSNTLGM